jgi:hypothetical protein
VAAITLVDVEAAGLNAGERFHFGNDGAERMAIVGIAMQRFGVEHELATLRLGDRGCHRDLAAELVGRSGLALADTLDLGRVQAVELPAALALPLAAYLIGPRQRDGEALLEVLVAIDPASNFANKAAEAGAQERNLI